MHHHRGENCSASSAAFFSRSLSFIRKLLANHFVSYFYVGLTEVVSGGGAGGLAAAVVYPLDLLRTRMALQKDHPKVATAACSTNI